MLTRLVTLHTSLTATATEPLPRLRPESPLPRAASAALDPPRMAAMQTWLQPPRGRAA